jgi:hypothetical protein
LNGARNLGVWDSEAVPKRSLGKQAAMWRARADATDNACSRRALLFMAERTEAFVRLLAHLDPWGP